MQQTATENPLKLTTVIPCPVSGVAHWRISVTRLGKKKVNKLCEAKINKGCQAFVSFIFFVIKSYLISSRDFSFKKKKNRKIQNTENGLFTSVRLMTSLLTPNDYTIEPQQRHNVPRYEYNCLTIIETFFLYSENQK